MKRELLLDVLTWQATVASSLGPRGYTLRLVLLALSTRMLAEGTNYIRITKPDLANAADLSLRWTDLMLAKAETLGWLTIGRPRKGSSHRMPACEYRLRLPDVPRETKPAHHDTTEARP